LELSPGLKKFLEKIGVNTTRLQWRLHQRELRKNEKQASRLPSWLRWMQYSHKFCAECGQIVDREDKLCPRCGAKVRSMGMYRFLRTIGIVMPEGGMATSMGFLVVMVGIYIGSIFLEGPTSILSPSKETLYKFGAYHPSVLEAGHYWRIFSFGLFHIGLLHIVFNSMALLQIGPLIEEDLGAKRMLVLITFAQIATAIAVTFVWPSAVVGASGWIFGLIGFGISYYHRQGRHAIRDALIKWAIYGFFFGYMIHASNAAHFGGMVGGILLGFTADLTNARRGIGGRIWDFLAWPCLAVWIATLYFLVRSILQS